jgi:hypothetical protein
MAWLSKAKAKQFHIVSLADIVKPEAGWVATLLYISKHFPGVFPITRIIC